MPKRTILEINTNNLLHNLNYFRSLLDPKTKVMVMVKAFGYGLGNPEISRILEEGGVDYLGVAFIDEGVSLRKAGIKKPLLVMNPHPDLFDSVLKYNLEPEVYSLNVLSALDEFTRNHLKSIRIHLKVETGMNRLGFDKRDYPEMLSILKKNNLLEIVGILSHLSSAEVEEENEFSLQQFREFEDAYETISNELGIYPMRHILNTAGAINFPAYQSELVRLGIGIYGVDRATNRESPLKTVCSLKSVVSQIKILQKGQTVGYGRAGVVEKDNTKIAIIAMGYADGIYRTLGNGQSKVWINGQLAPTIGNICMDMFMVDITGLAVEEGDEVEIFGENLGVEVMAEAAKTIPYEVFTSVGERVERVYV